MSHLIWIIYISAPSPYLMKNLVFIVEDNPVQQKMLQVHFEEMLGNYKVKTFTDPDDMMTHLHEKPFAVVLDHFFNDKRDITGLDYLRDLKNKRSSVPVIYHTTLKDETVKKQVLELGAVDYIIKDSASLVRLRTALDSLHEKMSRKSFLQKLFRR
jgi:DNA-binding response OmpR family regulator